MKDRVGREIEYRRSEVGRLTLVKERGVEDGKGSCCKYK